MRAGWFVSLIGHVGAIMMTLLAWEVRSTILPGAGSVVPVEIVDVAAESNVRALAEAVPDDLVEEESDQTRPQEASVTAPDPRARNAPQTDEWDPSQIARLLNTDERTGRRQQEGERSNRNQQGAGLGTAEVAAIEDRLRALARAHITRNNCWRMPIDLPEPDRLVVTVQFDVNRNGTLNGQPRVVSPRNYTFDPAMRTAVEAAVRAVRLCDPFPFADDPVVAEHYELWREMEYTFRPRL